MFTWERPSYFSSLSRHHPHHHYHQHHLRLEILITLNLWNDMQEILGAPGLQEAVMQQLKAVAGEERPWEQV